MKRKIIIRYLCILVFGISNSNSVFSQLTEWKNYTNKDWIQRMMDDGEYLWIGTAGGLVKMNKLTGEKSFYDRANPGLPDNRIVSLAKDSLHNIWVGTKYSGVGCFDGKNITNYNESNSGIEYEQYCTAIAVDANNNKWIGSLFFLNKFDGKDWQSFTTPNSHLISSIWMIYSMKFDKDGVLWLGGTGGWAFAKFTGSELQVLLEGNEVYGVEIDKEDNKWLATKYGLIKYDGVNFTKYDNTNSSLPCNKFVDISKDQEDNLWLIGEEGHLIKYDGETFTNFRVPLTNKQSWLTCIEADNDGNIWIGTRHEGIYKFKDEVFSYVDINDSPLLTNDISFCADVDKEDNVWIGTAYNLIKVDEWNKWNALYQKVEYSGQQRILGVNCAPNENMWISLGVSDTCVLKISKKDTVAFTLKNTPIFKDLTEYSNSNFVFDRKGNVWMASRAGLFKYDGNTWSCFTPDNSPLPEYHVVSVAIDKEDNLWVGSASLLNSKNGGLYKYNGVNWTIYNTTNSGLPTPYVGTMAFDSENVLWLNCRDTTTLQGVVGRIFGGGLTRFDGKSWKSYNIDNSDIPSNTIMDIVIDKNDDLWLATYGRHVGITKFDGENWKSYNTDNSGIAWDNVSKITLDYKRDLIWLNHLDFGGISTAKLNFDGSGIETLRTATSDNSSLLYPNPAKDAITFRLGENEKAVQVKAYTMAGELLCSKTVTSNSVLLSDLNIRQKGLYLVQVLTESGKNYSDRLMVTE